jgi:hypothetical protein
LSGLLRRLAFFTPLVDVVIQSFGFHLHPHRLRAALPRSPFQLRLLAQNDLCLPLLVSLVGALRSLPVSRLYLALPLAVRPAPRLTGNFSPRLMASDTFFLGIVPCTLLINN